MRGIVRVVYLHESIILLTSMGGGAGRGGEGSYAVSGAGV